MISSTGSPSLDVVAVVGDVLLAGHRQHASRGPRRRIGRGRRRAVLATVGPV